MSEPRLVVVVSPHQNAFFPEVVEVLVDELVAASVAVVVTTEPGRHDVEADDVFVVVPPHEYVALEGSAFVDDPSVAARTIGISAEQPHQHFFDRNAELGARLGAVLDFSPLAVEAYRRAGVAARALPFGYAPRWDRYEPGPARPGSPRVLYLGNKRPRRLRFLAGAADSLARHRAHLLVSDNDVPNRTTGPSFVAGEDKRDLLVATRLLVNIHQGDDPYFEWLRFAEAAHCGTPVLSEASSHTAPFVAGTDFAEFAGDELGPTLDRLIDDDDRLADLAESAYRTLRQHPLSAAVDVIVATARTLLAAPPPPAFPARTRAEPIGADRAVPPSTGGALDDGTRHRARRRRARITVVASEPDALCAELASRFDERDVVVVDPGVLDERRARRLHDGLVVVAPAGCRPRPDAFWHLLERAGAFDDRRAGVPWTAVLDGRDADGEPTLEGVWPWEPWRLTSGQHLGRLVVTPSSIVRSAADWFDEEFRGHPHVAIQGWVAAHGGVGRHLPTPVAHVTGAPLDPAHRLPISVADHLRHRLLGRGSAGTSRLGG
ncbi:MAG: glycosyltransferase family protein [Ilumatobacteraceae bacterium]